MARAIPKSTRPPIRTLRESFHKADREEHEPNDGPQRAHAGLPPLEGVVDALRRRRRATGRREDRHGGCETVTAPAVQNDGPLNSVEGCGQGVGSGRRQKEAQEARRRPSVGDEEVRRRHLQQEGIREREADESSRGGQEARLPARPASQASATPAADHASARQGSPSSSGTAAAPRANAGAQSTVLKSRFSRKTSAARAP